MRSHSWEAAVFAVDAELIRCFANVAESSGVAICWSLSALIAVVGLD